MSLIVYALLFLGFFGYLTASMLMYPRTIVVFLSSILSVIIFVVAIFSSIKIIVFDKSLKNYQVGRMRLIWINFAFLMHSTFWLFYSEISLSFLNQDIYGVLVRILYCVFIPSIGVLIVNRINYSQLRQAFLFFYRAFWIICIIATLQYVVGEDNLPYFLHSDDRYFISINALGKTRVNGLIGNHIEFALSCCLMYYGYFLFEIHTKKKPHKVSLIDYVFSALIIMSSSRVFFVIFGALFFVQKMSAQTRRLKNYAKFIPIVLALFAVGKISGINTYVYEALFSPYNWSAMASTDQHYWEITNAIRSIVESPFFGNGVGDQAGDKSRLVTDGTVWALLVETGLFGTLTLLVYICTFVSLPINDENPLSSDYLSIIVLSSLFLSSQLLNSSYMNILNSTLFFFILSGSFVKRNRKIYAK
jgi:hypothetical protein